ncbi:acetate uptake transporter [Nocardioides sp. B-3]|uniref:acetate uptake transporter n=1 Tax=Nocardioides sp. B-3 TaxID=2895565 RepID=UPI002152C5F0|nr:acetate uptake transporter [Nocardioides sp. B-3]UUZ61530.1 acetate uptake transporter [Nocardioides sp. B-3]
MTEIATSPTPVAVPDAPPAPVGWGDPFPLGLASFGISALVLASVMSGLIDAAATPAVLSLALALGFLTEIVAGIIHFARGETFAGSVFTAYAGFWLSYALLVQFYGPMVTEDGAAITGMFLLAWAIFSTYMLIAALRTNLTTIVIFTLLCVVFYAAALGSFTSSTGPGQLAGYVLIADALVALYASAAIIINTTRERSVLPVP